MNKESVAALKREIKWQSEQFNHLKRWLSYLMIATTLALSFALLGSSLAGFVKPVFLTIFALLAACTFLVGLALKRGRDNLNALLQMLDHCSS